MKKLTAFFAVVALGLLTTLTASAQINISYTHSNTTQLITTPNSFTTNGISVLNFDPNNSASVNSLNTSDSKTFTFVGASANLVTPQSNPKTFALGTAFFRANSTASTGSFIFSSIYDFTVTGADEGTFSRQISLNYTVDLSNLTVTSISIVGDTLAGQVLATDYFTYKGVAASLTFVNNSQDIGTKNLYLGDLESSASATLELQTALKLTPVPEPSTYALMGASGLAALAGLRRFRSKKASKV